MPKTPDYFRGKTIIITGAASGTTFARSAAPAAPASNMHNKTNNALIFMGRLPVFTRCKRYG